METIISKNDEVAEKLNNFFIKAVENLEIEQFAPNAEKDIQTTDVEKIIKMHERHPSIMKNKGKC